MQRISIRCRTGRYAIHSSILELFFFAVNFPVKNMTQVRIEAWANGIVTPLEGFSTEILTAESD